MAEAGFDLQNVAEEDLYPDSAEPEVSFGYMDASAKQPWRLRLNENGRRALISEMEGRSEAYRSLDSAALEECSSSGR